MFTYSKMIYILRPTWQHFGRKLEKLIIFLYHLSIYTGLKYKTLYSSRCIHESLLNRVRCFLVYSKLNMWILTLTVLFKMFVNIYWLMGELISFCCVCSFISLFFVLAVAITYYLTASNIMCIYIRLMQVRCKLGKLIVNVDMMRWKNQKC